MALADRYDVVDCLYDGRDIEVYRARARRGGASVVLKAQKPGAHAAARLRHEYDILKGLDAPGIVRASGLEDQGSEVALVLDDLGGETLFARLARGPMPLRETLGIAAEMAEILGEIHRRRVIHKDINPCNILLDREGRARVFDFDIATRVPREIQSIRPQNLLAGTLPYISPEQTGRMNRAIDYRTDLYSFGVTLYQMLMGRVPFSAGDPIELIHCHIAKVPTPPADIDPSIPAAVSGIAMKLLEKTAEARYQSAFGLKADLDECRQRLALEGRIESFPLGRKDVSDRFQIPQKLYGREQEIGAIEAAFARAQAGTPELLLVSGSSGVGKSSVIQELYRSLSRCHAYFVSGKFEELKRDIPYSALLQALTELVRDVLAEPGEKLAAFRGRIQAAVRDSGGVLTSVLPPLTHILGVQPPAPELTGMEAKNRFRHLFESFIQAFTRHGQPLVIFLDDLQWADTATLELMTSLLSDRGAGALLFIAAYRDNEVSAGHPLLSCIADIEQAGGAVTRIALNPLRAPHVCQLIEDALWLPQDDARPLAELVWRRTMGNPLFVGELLTMLHRDGLIELDPGRLRWTYDLAQIERARGTENVGELMAARAAALGARCREVLQLAAILGSRFDLVTLATISERSPEEAAAALEETLRDGLVLPMGQEPCHLYRFLHDRVQEAVYTSIPEEARIEVHHRAGQLLLKNQPEGDRDEWLFQVLHHMNLAAARVSSPEQRLELARMSLDAAGRAAASGAFAAAAQHHAAGIRFLPEGAWASHRALTFSLHLGLAENEYLRGNQDAAEQLFERLRREAHTELERVQVLKLIHVYERHTGRFREALATALEALDLLGIKLRPRPRLLVVAFDFLKTKRAVGKKSPSELLSLREVTDPRVLLVFDVLVSSSNSALFADPLLWVRLCLKLVRMVLERGNSRYAAMGFAFYAIILSQLGDYAAADAWRRFALKLAERYPDKCVESHLRAMQGGGSFFHRNPLGEAVRHQEEAYQFNLLSGNLTVAGYNLEIQMQTLFVTGAPLDKVLQTCERNRHIFRRIKDDRTWQSQRMYEAAVLALQGHTRSLGSFDTDDFDEARHAAKMAALGTKTSLYYYWTTKISVLYLFGRYEEALAISAGARGDARNGLLGTPHGVTYRFYDALLVAAVAGNKGAFARQRDLRLLRGYVRKFKTWAENAPMNFRHTYLILAAELSRLTKKDVAAIGQYEEAIKVAQENEFVQDEAIALELAGKFYQSRGLADIAIGYLARARQAYARWGGHAKVALLDQAYPGLAARAEQAEGVGRQLLTTTTSSSTTSGTLDAPTMIKASQALSGEIALDRLLLRLMNIVAENAGAERGALVLEQRGALVVVAEFSVRDGARLPERPLPIAESDRLSPGITAYVMRTHETVIMGDACREGAFVADGYVARTKPRAVLCAPLLQKGEVKGVLYLENNLVPGAFTAERAELLGALCAQMAISIDNAYLYADLEEKVIERTRALKAAQARLVQLEREATETQMAGGFAHEMRNALTGAKLMLARVMRSSQDEPTSTLCLENSGDLKQLFLRVREEVSETTLESVSMIACDINEREELLDTVLRGVDRCVDRGLGITGLILDYAQLGRARPGSEEVAVEPLVKAVLEELEDDLLAHQISVSVIIPNACTFAGNELHLHAILKNLVANARDALLEVRGGAGRAIRIEVIDEPARKVLVVSDNGIGIAPELHDKVFEPFFTTKLQTGTGLGLGVVRRLTSLYGGAVELESDRGRGATFRVSFPKAEVRAVLASADRPLSAR
jgi:predicted ATPase/signal transduction histidine kinase